MREKLTRQWENQKDGIVKWKGAFQNRAGPAASGGGLGGQQPKRVFASKVSLVSNAIGGLYLFCF